MGYAGEGVGQNRPCGGGGKVGYAGAGVEVKWASRGRCGGEVDHVKEGMKFKWAFQGQVWR